MNQTTNNNFSFITGWDTEVLRFKVLPLTVSGRDYRFTTVSRHLKVYTHKHFLVFPLPYSVCRDYYCPFYRWKDWDPGPTQIYWCHSTCFYVYQALKKQHKFSKFGGKCLILTKGGNTQQRLACLEARSSKCVPWTSSIVSPELLSEMNFTPDPRPSWSESNFNKVPGDVRARSSVRGLTIGWPEIWCGSLRARVYHKDNVLVDLEMRGLQDALGGGLSDKN